MIDHNFANSIKTGKRITGFEIIQILEEGGRLVSGLSGATIVLTSGEMRKVHGATLNSLLRQGSIKAKEIRLGAVTTHYILT
ncbi:hypothetical protein LCGC14_0264610 [marine sediment metagenome]|uniref:Uncharacterized protein n=1 Tax=marine sediment metagenome TaxID=412755 RepID=A0A0F9X5R3_9ZZZZ